MGKRQNTQKDVRLLSELLHFPVLSSFPRGAFSAILWWLAATESSVPTVGGSCFWWEQSSTRGRVASCLRAWKRLILLHVLCVKLHQVNAPLPGLLEKSPKLSHGKGHFSADFYFHEIKSCTEAIPYTYNIVFWLLKAVSNLLEFFINSYLETNS